jgi:abequosyltransferase
VSGLDNLPQMKLLTVSIPTFNRSLLLDKQLAWLYKAIQGFESECEIFISDNCSIDNTQEVIRKWQEKFTFIKVINNQNSENIGVIRNVINCYNSAQTKYVWTIGDDDPIEEGAISYVISKLREIPDLSYMILNFSLFDTHTNKFLYHTTFDVDTELLPDGKTYIESYLKQQHRGLGFLSAQIYRTETIQQALESWSDSFKNLEAQIYWGAFCAINGKVLISKKVYLQNARIRYLPKVRVKMHFVDLPVVFIKLMSIGYSPDFRQRIVDHIGNKGLGRLLYPMLKKYPIFTVKYVLPSLALIASNVLPLKKEVL